jgi:threonine dehydrogenase-like Zn-dependent dehydrogenase
VAIVGAGAIGILAAAAAQTVGVQDVAVEARHPHQHEARERIGAVRTTTGYDVVIETGGSESALQRAVELARPGGTVVYVGVYDADTTWPHQAAFTREIALRPSLGYCGHHGRREFAEAAEMLVSRPELARMPITTASRSRTRRRHSGWRRTGRRASSGSSSSREARRHQPDGATWRGGKTIGERNGNGD